MIIEIERIPKEGLKISKDFEFFSTDLVEENAVFQKPVHAEMIIKKGGEEIYMKGRIATCMSFVCSRCLVPFEFPVDSSFDLVYLPEEFETAQDHFERDDMNRMFYYSRQINLKKEVLEQLNLTFPVKPLCSKECQGICPVCGKIMQDGKCSCLITESDPRLEKLKTFIRDKR